MTTKYLAPYPHGYQFTDDNGDPLALGKIYTYVAGTTTPKATYKDNAGVASHTNPIVLGADGRVPGDELWLDNDQDYDLDIQNAAGTTITYADDVAPIVPAAVATQSEWVDGPSPTYIGATQFSVGGDYTSTLMVGRRLKLADASTLYATISAVAYTTLTTVTVVVDAAGSLSASLASFQYGILAASNVSVPVDSAPAVVLADADVTIGRGYPRTLQMTPTASRNVTVDNSFENGEWRVIENKAAAFNIVVKANDGTTVVTIPGGASCALRTRTAAPATLTDWGALANFLLMRGGAAPSTPAAGTVTVGAVSTDAFGVAKSALRSINEAGTAWELGGGAANRILSALGLDFGALYNDATGTSGADNTLQKVKGITIPANAMAAGRGIIIVCGYETNTSTSSLVILRLGTANDGTDSLLISNATYAASTGGMLLGFVFPTGANTLNTVSLWAHYSNVYGTSKYNITTNINTANDMFCNIWQNAVAGASITVRTLGYIQLG